MVKKNIKNLSISAVTMIPFGLFVILAIILLSGCGKKEEPIEVTDDNEPIVVQEIISEEKDESVEENEEPAEAELILMSPEELFNAFCDQHILAEARSYYDDTTWTMDAGIYQFLSDASDAEYDATLAVERKEPVDLDNDGEVEFVLENPVYGDMCFDCKNGKVICFAQGEGTTAFCSYTKYEDAYWIVYSDTIHADRCTYNLVKFNGDLEATDSFSFGWEDWDEDGIKRFYKDDQDISEAEYDALLQIILSGSSSKNQELTEIEKVLMGKKEFTYIYEFFRCNDSYENPEYRSIKTDRFNFRYDRFAVEQEDGSIDMWESDTQWEKWTSVDLDNDGKDEAIYLITMGANEFYIIFHEIDGEVYGYAVGRRNIINLYRDGTIEGTAGAAYWWYERIEEFTPNGYTRNVFARAEDNKFTIEGKEVDEETFRAYMAKRDEKVGLVEWIQES